MFHGNCIVNRVNKKDVFNPERNYAEKLLRNLTIKNFKQVKPQVSSALYGYK